MSILSVSQVTSKIANLINNNFQNITVRGEVSNLKISSFGHIYFNLKDDRSLIHAVYWQNDSAKESEIIKSISEGLEVICTGFLSLYHEKSLCQLVVKKMEYSGQGQLLALLEKLKNNLRKEGLFSPKYKKSIPLFLENIAIITSLKGAALQDIISRLRETKRFVNITIWHSPVQGNEVAKNIISIINKINQLNANGREKTDLIIITRGGGSVEDLWPFNDEKLVRAVFASQIIIVSAIGHETDFTLLDLVADLRAPTPTAAVEMILLPRSILQQKIDSYWLNLTSIINEKIDKLQVSLNKFEFFIKNLLFIYQIKEKKLINQKDKINSLTNLYFTQELVNINRLKLSPQHLLTMMQNKSDLINKILERLQYSLRVIFVNKKRELQKNTSLLLSYDYHNTLKRGFALVRKNDLILKEIESLVKDDRIIIEMIDGKIEAVIK